MKTYKAYGNENRNKALVTKERVDLADQLEEQSLLNEFQDSISSFYAFFERVDIEGISKECDKISSLLHRKNEKLFNMIINGDFLSFLSTQLNDEDLPQDVLLIILKLTEMVLISNNISITQILYENGALESFNRFLNSIYYDEKIIEKALNCIGYASFDLNKIQIKPNFDIKSEVMSQTLKQYENLYPIYMNLLSNALYYITDYDSAIENINYYISLIDFDKCSKLNIINLLRNMSDRIENLDNKKFSYEIFKDTNIFGILFNIITNSQTYNEIISGIDEDILYWSLRLIINFLNNDNDEDLFYKKFAIIQPNDFYNLIVNYYTTDDSLSEIFHLLTFILKKDEEKKENFYIQSFIDLSFLKRGRENLFNFEAYFSSLSFKPKVWYLRFLSIAISIHSDIEPFEDLFSSDFIEDVVSYLDPYNYDMSKSVLSVVLAVLDKSILFKIIEVIDILLDGEENPFDELIEDFTDEVEDVETQNLALVVIRRFYEFKALCEQITGGEDDN